MFVNIMINYHYYYWDSVPNMIFLEVTSILGMKPCEVLGEVGGIWLNGGVPSFCLVKYAQKTEAAWHLNLCLISNLEASTSHKTLHPPADSSNMRSNAILGTWRVHISSKDHYEVLFVSDVVRLPSHCPTMPSFFPLQDGWTLVIQTWRPKRGRAKAVIQIGLCSLAKVLRHHVGWRVTILGGSFMYLFIFTPNLGEMIQFDEHIFQMGWNHQLVIRLVTWMTGRLFRG